MPDVYCLSMLFKTLKGGLCFGIWVRFINVLRKCENLPMHKPNTTCISKIMNTKIKIKLISKNLLNKKCSTFFMTL